MLPTTGYKAAAAGVSPFGVNSLLSGKALNFASWSVTQLTDYDDSTSVNTYVTGNSYSAWYPFKEPVYVGRVYYRVPKMTGYLEVQADFEDGTSKVYRKDVSTDAISSVFFDISASKKVKKITFGISPWTNLIDVDAEMLPTPDTTPPGAPTGLTGVAGDTKVDLRWNANSEPDLDHYVVYVDGVAKATVKTNTATITGLANGREYTIKVTAVDKSTNESKPSGEIKLTPEGPPPPDTTPPAVPTLSGKAGNKQALLSWSRVGDADLAGYRLYMDGGPVGTYTGTSANVSELKNGHTYKFAVTAFDKSGNESGKSNTVSITPAESLNVTLIPNGDSIVVQISNGSGPYVIDWEAASKTVDQSQYTIGGLQFDTEYTVTVTDASGLVFKQKINTGKIKGYVPPTFPSPQETFQKMLDVFGTAGTIALAIIGGAIALGIMCVLALWAWRLLRNWLARAR